MIQSVTCHTVQAVEMSAMVLSAQFWPAFREEKLSLPPHMQAMLAEFTTKFEALKGNRTLNWKSHLGEHQSMSRHLVQG